MRIEVIVYGGYGPGRQQCQLEIRPADTVEKIAERLSLPAARLIMINGRLVPPDRQLKEGDILEVFPPLSGG